MSVRIQGFGFRVCLECVVGVLGLRAYVVAFKCWGLGFRFGVMVPVRTFSFLLVGFPSYSVIFGNDPQPNPECVTSW